MTPEQLQGMVDGFNWMLEGYDIDDVKTALAEYMTKHDDMPAPANIIALLEKRPIYCRSVYNEIKARLRTATEYVSRREKQYVTDYEANALNEAGV